MEKMNLFWVPVFSFEYENQQELKNVAMDYLKDDNVYEENTRRNTLYFTSPELHKKEIFKDFKNFVQKCLAECMVEMGYFPSIQITAMWATKHVEAGFHQRHSHGNSFLAGVYYLNGTENNSGTRFYNVHRNHSQIIPGKLPNVPEMIQSNIVIPFTEGKLLIFPSWLEHDTGPNYMVNTKSERYILGFNSMPVGKTTSDEFDRYNYQDISNAELITKRE
jgi:uncharacterized protein (TIGR02466 family)